MPTKILDQHLADLRELTEHFINQEMPDRAPEGAPWEQTVKNRIEQELLSTKENRQLVATFLIAANVPDVDFANIRMLPSEAEFFDTALSSIDDEVLQRKAHVLAEEIFDGVMERMTTRGEAALREKLNRRQENQE